MKQSIGSLILLLVIVTAVLAAVDGPVTVCVAPMEKGPVQASAPVKDFDSAARHRVVVRCHGKPTG
jgi:hypothetical protein